MVSLSSRDSKIDAILGYVVLRDAKLTEIMFRSLRKDPKLASYDEWIKAGDFALEMRFFPHAFSCFQMAAEINKDENVLIRLQDTLEKITNVLEFVPIEIKALVDEIRFNNPLDPSKWMAIVNSLLKESVNEIAFNKIEASKLNAIKFALAFAAYVSLRSGAEIDLLNDLLKDFLLSSNQNHNPKLDLRYLSANQIKTVVLGDNISLGLEPDWSINFQSTYHYLWSKDSGLNVSLASNAISGAGVLDLALYLGRDAIYYKPDLAIIMLGNNDAWFGKTIHLAYQALLEACINILHEHNIKVLLVSPLPHLPEACPPDQRPTDVDLDEVEIDDFVRITKLVAQNTNSTFVDLLTVFPKNKEDRKKYLINGFNQPNLEGHKLIAKAIDQVVIK